MNVLGMTPLDYTAPGEAGRLKTALESRGFEVVSIWAMGEPENPFPQIRQSLQADVNLVVSSCGIDTARWMELTFGIPYVPGVPCGSFAEVLYGALSEAVREGKSSIPYLDILAQHADRKTGRCIAGEAVTAGSLAADRILKDGKACDMVPLTETVRGLIPEDACCPKGESQIREVLGAYEEVTADPMLKEACRSGCRFEELPHFALSGRMFLDRIRPLIEMQNL